MNQTVILFVALFGVRLVSLFRSISNEKRLKAQGAVEYGKTNSLILTIVHILFYASALWESLHFQRVFNTYTYIGIGVFVFSMIALWIVIFSIKDVWTVKLYIAKNHVVNKNFLFRNIKHPNYFLNIIPELIAVGITFQSWFTLFIGLPLYLIPLTIRIRQEESIMKEILPEYI